MKKKLQSKISLVFFVFLAIGVIITGAISLIFMSTMLPPEAGDIDGLNRQLAMYELISVALGFILASAIGYQYIKRLLMPITELANITKRITRGEPVRSKEFQDMDDEIGVLTVNFNLINQKLEDAVAQLQERNNDMDAVMSGMQSGVIALDEMRTISIVNPYAEKIFGISQKQVKGKTLEESVFSDYITRNINSLSIQNPKMDFEAEVNFPVYRICRFNCSIMRAVSDPMKFNGIVIMIQDVTEIRKLENMRKDFVANVSHELKTPLTSIKGFVETLLDGDIEDKETRNRFLNIINIETDRLFYLIQDILTLSEIEDEESVIVKEEIEPVLVANDVMQLLKEQASSKNINLTLESPEDLPKLKGKKRWFHQMLINLMDNALKYTPENGEVKLSLTESDGSVIIKVKDTGIGIPAEDIMRIFERFYRVDKDRSRSVGGTGLGLAIVKHVALSFDGSVDVKSELGKGTEFTIEIPIEKPAVLQ